MEKVSGKMPPSPDTGKVSGSLKSLACMATIALAMSVFGGSIAAAKVKKPSGPKKLPVQTTLDITKEKKKDDLLTELDVRPPGLAEMLRQLASHACREWELQLACEIDDLSKPDKQALETIMLARALQENQQKTIMLAKALQENQQINMMMFAQNAELIKIVREMKKQRIVVVVRPYSKKARKVRKKVLGWSSRRSHRVTPTSGKRTLKTKKVMPKAASRSFLGLPVTKVPKWICDTGNDAMGWCK